jgi:hypothetical protein
MKKSEPMKLSNPKVEEKEAEGQQPIQEFPRKKMFSIKGMPFLCPVCEGRGIVPYNFYSVEYETKSSITPVACRTCGGEGIVWG